MKVKDSIRHMHAYVPKSIQAKIILDANEQNYQLNLSLEVSTLQTLNRYPEHQSPLLIHKLYECYGYDKETILLGSGSSELLDLIIKTYIQKDDVVLSIDPTFVMYEQYTLTSNGVFKSVAESTQTLEDLYQAYLQYMPKLIIISNPNNPTGTYLDRRSIETFLSQVDCLVIIDEAYIEFVDETQSLTQSIDQFPHLFVTRSFSKAFGLAGARLGYVVAQKARIDDIKIAKTPYSISTLSAYLGIKALEQRALQRVYIKDIIQSRRILTEALDTLNIVHTESFGNFVYVYEPRKDLYADLLDKGILIRSYRNGFYRISIGTQEEIQEVIKQLKELYHV